MLQEGIASNLESIIDLMYTSNNETLNFSDSNRSLSVKVNLKQGSNDEYKFSLNKDKQISFKTEDFPIFSYHNSIARLTPIYNQLLFLEKHPKLANSNLLLSFAATVSNVILMLNEQSLIKTENLISDFIPQQYRNDIIIVSGPIGENFVFTVHFVKLLDRSSSKEVDGPTYWKQFAQDTIISHCGNDYVVLDSCLMKSKSKIQPKIINQLRSLQMLLSSISTNMSVEEDEINAGST